MYAGLRARGESDDASALAAAVGALLGWFIALAVLAGVLAAPWLVELIAPGFTGPKRELTVALVRIFFPGAGLLVFSAWCLGILNSHGRFFLSYAAPIVWNAAIIGVLLWFGPGSGLPRLAALAAWGSVGGSLLQVLVQVPAVRASAGRLRLEWSRAAQHRREVIRNFVPAFLSRGVVQVSAYVDALLASLLPTGAVAALSYAQTLYTLPVSLFGMSISAAELPAMSGAVGEGEAVASFLRERLNRGLRQIAFFVVPSAVAFAALGDVLAGALFQSGRFSRADAVWVWGILAGSAVGLLASTMGRLYASTWYALRDTRTPLRIALLRVTLTIALGYLLAIPLPPALGIPARWGAAGLTISAGIAGWIEFALLRASLNRRLGPTGLPARLTVRLYGAAAMAAGAAWLLDPLAGGWNPVLRALVVLGVYGGVYVCLTWIFQVPEVKNLLTRVRPGA